MFEYWLTKDTQPTVKAPAYYPSELAMLINNIDLVFEWQKNGDAVKY